MLLCYMYVSDRKYYLFLGTHPCKARVSSRGSESGFECDGVRYRSFNRHVIICRQRNIFLSVTHETCILYRKLSGITFLFFCFEHFLAVEVVNG
jgi:hypothetical protein